MLGLGLGLEMRVRLRVWCRDRACGTAAAAASAADASTLDCRRVCALAASFFFSASVGPAMSAAMFGFSLLTWSG